MAGGCLGRGVDLHAVGDAKCFPFVWRPICQGEIEPVDGHELPAEDGGLIWKCLSRARLLESPSVGWIGWVWTGEPGSRGTTSDPLGD